MNFEYRKNYEDQITEEIKILLPVIYLSQEVPKTELNSHFIKYTSSKKIAPMR